MKFHIQQIITALGRVLAIDRVPSLTRLIEIFDAVQRVSGFAGVWRSNQYNGLVLPFSQDFNVNREHSKLYAIFPAEIQFCRQTKFMLISGVAVC